MPARLTILFSLVSWLMPTLVAAQDKRTEPVLRVDPIHSVPYGVARFVDASGTLQTMRAYPSYARDMHAFGSPGPTDLANEKWTREGWRIAVSNDSRKSIRLQHLRLERVSYSPLPARYVCLWDRKGFVEPRSKDVALKSATVDYPLSPNGGEWLLDPGEPAIVMVRIVSAQPGIYRLRVAFTYQEIGSDRAESYVGQQVFDLLVPNRSDGRGAYLIGPEPRAKDFGERILKLRNAEFEALVEESQRESWLLNRAPANEVPQALEERDDAKFLRWLRDWKDMATAGALPAKSSADAMGAPMPVGTTLAMYLADNPQTEEVAIDVLNQYRVQSPQDDVAIELLMELLLRRKRIGEATSLFQELETGPQKDSAAYYMAGLGLATSTKDDALAARLRQGSAELYPEKLSLFRYRLAAVSAPRDVAAASQEISHFCKYADMLSDDEHVELAVNVWEWADQFVSRPQPGRAAALREVVRRCPPLIGLLLRTHARLWVVLPELRLPQGLIHDSAQRDEWLNTGLALALSSRTEKARELFVRAHQRFPTDTEITSNLIDALLLTGKVVEAGKFLADAVHVDASASEPVSESTYGRYLLTLLRTNDFVGLVRLHDDHAALLAPLIAPPSSSQIPPRIASLVRLTHAAAVGTGPLIFPALVRWTQFDPMEALGAFGVGAMRYWEDLVVQMSAYESGERADDAKRGDLSKLPKILSQMLEDSYVRLTRGVVANQDLTLEEEVERRQASPWLMPYALKRGGVEVFFVRTRRGVESGTDIDGRQEIWNGANRIPFADWLRANQEESAGAAPGVYLVPMKGTYVDDELRLHAALAKAFGSYEVESAEAEVLEILTRDPKNTEAWLFAAETAAARADQQACLERAAKGLALDAEHERLHAVQMACREWPANTLYSQASRSPF